MRKKYLILAPVISLFPFYCLAAQELRLPQEPATVEVSVVPVPREYKYARLTEYQETYSALKAYSDIASVSPMGSSGYVEASASGQYLRAKLEGLASAMQLDGSLVPLTDARTPGGISFKIFSELNDVFGFSNASAVGAETRGVVIKQGYCQVNYVKNNVPFLVQSDSFLKKGEIILTFDDGPGPLTEEVSASMKEGGAPSVFFVLGSKMGTAGKERLKKAAADGHEISVHGYNHATEAGKPFTAFSTQETLKQLGGVRDSITAAVNKKPGFFRPPYGIISIEALKAIDSELGLVPVGWTIDTLDWSTKDPDELFEKTIALIKQRGKGIVLMHDIHSQSRTASKRLVKWLAENGYTVVSPDRMTKAYRGE